MTDFEASDLVAEPILVLDAAGRVVQANVAARKLFVGLELGTPFKAHAADVRELQDLLRRMSSRAQPSFGALTITNATGASRYRVSGARLSPAGAPVKIGLRFLLSRGNEFSALSLKVKELNAEIHQHRRARRQLEETLAANAVELQEALERLRESERSFTLLVEGVTDYALYMLDPTGQVVSWNAGAQRIKGYAATEIIGRHFSCFYAPEDREADLPGRGLRTAAREGRLETEGWRIRKDGSRFWAHVVIDAIYSDGTLVGFAKITRDITEQKVAEAQLRQAQKMEAVGQFTGGAAHDFNNLLMAISGSLELLRKRLPNDQGMVRLLDTAMQGVKRGSTLTQRMLAFARRQDLKREVVELAGLIGGMAELIERSVGPAIRIATDLPQHFPPVHTDASQLEAAVLNLIINASDAMPSGGVVSLKAREEQVEPDHPSKLAPGRYACLSVSDTGHGMDAETLARVAEPFFTTKGVGKGTGLGLSMVDGFLAQSGGRLMMRSHVGEGTTVELWLPIAVEEIFQAEEEPQLVEASEVSRAESSLVILAVDDDSLVLMNTAAMLEDLGHKVIDVLSGAQALKIVNGDLSIDLLVSDQAMPGMTGMQLIETIRARHPKLPVILATGYAELPGGPDPSIQTLAKPFTQRELAQALAAVMDR